MSTSPIRQLHAVPDLIEGQADEFNVSSTITDETAQSFVTALQQAAQRIASEHGLTVQQYELGKTAFDLSVNLLVAPYETVQFDIHFQNYISYCSKFNLKPEWLNQTITGVKSGQKFEAKITGLVVKKGQTVVRMSTNEGPKYLSPSSVTKMMGSHNNKHPYSTMALQIAHAERDKDVLVKKLFGSSSKDLDKK
ncbi:hypothetical protein [Vibrio alginolyticus]|uniref:hypothetical protein n=1 Tax=Vibrio alginolyticus TaxID=663 RepID=UPI0015F67DD4|nr:hypothetical protein [Vibrio alginolyticus]EJE4208692.1 hypothetical protein [Vibrio parahaemolyticus]